MSTNSLAGLPLVGGIMAEGRAFARALTGPAVYIVALVGALLLATAYQARPSYHIVVGGPTDRPYVNAIHSPENDPDLGRPYRWTQPDSAITLLGIGAQDVTVRLEVSGGRPPGAPAPQVAIYSGGVPGAPGRLVDSFAPPPEIVSHTVALARDPDLAGGDLRLIVRTTNPFTTTTDPRLLGVRLFAIDVQPTATPGSIVIPPISQATPLFGAALLCTLLLLRLGWGSGGATLGGLAWCGATAAFLVWDRVWLTSFAWALPQVLIIAYFLVLVLGPLIALLYRWGGINWPGLERRGLLTIFAAAVVARLGGQLHPEIFIPDLGFHMNRLGIVMQGQLLFTIFSAEWGNHQTFYLPAVYVFMMPVQWLLHDPLLAIRIFTVVLDSTSVFMLYYLARRALGSGGAGVWASVLFVTLPQAVLIFSWGITANVFAQWTMLAVVTVVIAGYERLNRPLVWALLVATLLLALLSHPGTVQMTGVMMALTLGIWAWLRRRVGPGRSWWLVGGALVTAAGLAFLLYYVNWINLELTEFAAIQAERARLAGGAFRVHVGGSVNDLSMDLYSYYVYSRQAQVIEGLWGFWKEGWAYYKTWPLLWTALGLLAAAPVTRALRRLRTMAVAWGITAVIFAIVGLVENLYVRYVLFLLPLVALGGGALLEWLRRRGWAGRALLALTLGGFAVQALALWWWRIMFYLK